MKEVSVLDVPIAAMTAPEALSHIRQALEKGERLQVVTVNAEILMRCRKDEEYAAVVRAADLRLADGVGVVWAAHAKPRGYLSAFGSLLKLAVNPQRSATELPGTIPGSDLVIELAGMCEEFGYRLFLLGAGPGVAEAAAAELEARFPQLQIAGAMAGSPRPAQDATVRKGVAETQPQVVLVAYGVPKQELWIARNLAKLPAPCAAIGVGGTFDYLAGAVSLEGGRAAKQPPGVIRRRGLESFWRLFTQPARWRRIFTAVVLFPLAVVRARRGR